MPIVNNQGYVEVTGRSKRNPTGKSTRKSWWLIKHVSKNRGILKFSDIVLPERYIGKRVRLKVEVIK